MGAKKQAVKSKKVWIKVPRDCRRYIFCWSDGVVSNGFKLDFIACYNKTR